MKLLTIIMFTSALYSCGADDSTSSAESPAVQASAKDTIASAFVGDYKMDCNTEYSAVVEVTEARVKTVLTRCSNANDRATVKTDYAYKVVQDLGGGEYKVEITDGEISKVYQWSLIDNVLMMGNANLRIEPKFLKQ